MFNKNEKDFCIYVVINIQFHSASLTVNSVTLKPVKSYMKPKATFPSNEAEDTASISDSIQYSPDVHFIKG